MSKSPSAWKFHWLPSSPPCWPPSSPSPAPRFHPLAASSFWKHFPSTWTSQGGGAWQGLCSRWPRVATAEVESNSVAKGNSGSVPDKLNPSSDLKGKSRLKEIRGKVKGQGNPAGGQECTCKPRPSERVQRHIDESRRDNKNAFFFLNFGVFQGLMRAGLAL